MDIYPHDLGPEGEKVLQARQPPSSHDPDTPWPAWMVGIAVGSVGVLVSLSVGKAYYSTHADWLGLLVSSLVGTAAAVLQRRRTLRRTDRPLTVSEVRDLKAHAIDPLQQSYLNLVMVAVATSTAQDVETQAGIREAIRALGESIAGLQVLVTDGTRDDPAALGAQAEQLASDAAAEGDPVIAASLHRRAEAMHRQAETAARTSTLLRRNEALRQEVAGQIAALQTSLTALRVGGAQAVYELAGVAASIQQVAVEASALTQARSEVGEIVNGQALTRG